MKKPATRPRGYTTVTASLAVADVTAALEFLKSAFNAEVKVTDDEDAPSFASVKLGNAMMFITTGWAGHGHLPQTTAVTTPVSLHLYVEDIAASIGQAIEAGAILISEPQDMYWGERTAALADPFGHRWTIAERLDQLSHEEVLARRQGLITEEVIAEDVVTEEVVSETAEL